MISLSFVNLTSFLQYINLRCGQSTKYVVPPHLAWVLTVIVEDWKIPAASCLHLIESSLTKVLADTNASLALYQLL